MPALDPAPVRARTRAAGLASALLLLALLVICAFAWAGCGGEDLDARLGEFEQEIQAGHAAGILDPLRALVDRHPERTDAQHLLGAAYLQAGQNTLAIFPLEKAAEDPKLAASANTLLASALLATESFDAAAVAATRALEADPSQSGLLGVRARAHLGGANPEEALADATALLALHPDSYEASLLRAAALTDLERPEEAEQAYLSAREVAARESPTAASRGCLALATFYEEDAKDLERARAVLEECLAASPKDGLTIRLASEFFDRREETERAEQILRDALAATPEGYAIRVALANRLLRAGKADEAQALLTAATEGPHGADAWRLLAELHRHEKRPEEASRALDQMLARLPAGADREPAIFEQADLAIDAGDLDRAEALAATLEKPEYREMVRGRILLQRGDAEGSLAAFEAGTRLWPNNAYARYLAGRAALASGAHDKARKHLREATRADASATDAALFLGQLYLADGRYEDAIGMLKRHIASRPGSGSEAFRLAARAYTGLGFHDQALRILGDGSKLDGDPVAIEIERAAVRRAAKGSAAAAQSLSESRLDLSAPEATAALGVLVEDLLATGRIDEAKGRVALALAKQGETPPLLVLRGRVHHAGGARAEAHRDWLAALEADPDLGEALVGLAGLARESGDVDGALALYDRAVASEQHAGYRAAQLLLAAGRLDEAETCLREVVKRDPGNAFACNDLAWLLAERGRDLELALELASRAARLSPGADVLDTLAWVQLKSGRPEAASISFRKALEQAPANATIWYHLGLAQLAAGDPTAAREAMQRALASGPFPDAEAARAQLARIEAGQEG